MKTENRKQKAPGHKHNARRRASAVCALVLGAILAAALPTFAQSRVDLRMTARVFNYAHISSRKMGRAETVAARIMGAAGVEMLWLDCLAPYVQGRTAPQGANPECAGQPDRATVFIQILPASTRAKDYFKDTVFGFVEGSAQANVFYWRIADAARADGNDWEAPTILGHIMAHELGHLLLGPNAHSPTGIMCGVWDWNYVQESMRERQTFTTSQSEVLRAAVRERNGETAHTSARTQ